MRFKPDFKQTLEQIEGLPVCHIEDMKSLRSMIMEKNKALAEKDKQIENIKTLL